MGFLVKAAAAALVGTVTVLIVLATLIDQARPAGERDGGGPVFLLGWFAFLLMMWAAWWLAGRALRAAFGRRTS